MRKANTILDASGVIKVDSHVLIHMERIRSEIDL